MNNEQEETKAIVYLTNPPEAGGSTVAVPASKRHWADDFNDLIEEATRRIVAEEIAKLEQRIRQNILDELAKEMIRLKIGRRAK